jgi:hypothetical protein
VIKYPLAEMLIIRDVSGFHITNLVKGQNYINPHHDRHVFPTSSLSDHIVGPGIIGAYPQEDIEQGLMAVCWPILNFATIMKDLYSHERNSSLVSIKLVNEFNGPAIFTNCLVSFVDLSIDTSFVESCIVEIDQ